MNAYKVYRNGTRTLAERIAKALEHYEIHNGGRLPETLAANPRDAIAVIEIVKGLGMPDLGVIVNGGVMAGEVWLQLPKGGGQ